jgi:hypothetical protein
MPKSRPTVTVQKSDRPGKKLKIVLTYEDGSTKTIHIGQASAEDYTDHHDDTRKASYTKRHKPRENWMDFTTAGFWAKHLLWNKTSLSASVKDTAKRFHLSIKNNA